MLSHLPRANMMPRLRRYRVFIIVGFVITLLLLQVSRNSQWDAKGPSFYDAHPERGRKPDVKGEQGARQSKQELDRTSSVPSETTSGREIKENVVKATTAAAEGPTRTTTTTSMRLSDLKTSDAILGGDGGPRATEVDADATTSPTRTQKNFGQPTTPPNLGIPDRNPGPVDQQYRNPDDTIHMMKPPAAFQNEMLTATETIHWMKQKEWFPLPTESIIPLPTGQPKKIPSVQYNFGDEAPAARETREARLAQVKAEMDRAWSGYRAYAWGHDELKPVSKLSADPFCGWAATLVDALDTLWIMGMKGEFEEAVEAVAKMDFTTTPFRQDIPVFETVIRYLGGLVGAFDVSGGRYKTLLDKAVELAEVLMGIFDTPNRMPVLYYYWMPAFASQPHRASNTVSVAELGSMAMEFTRLAQLTGENKYYDAIARITDALEEFQNRFNASAYPGIFPQQLDASGCNKTADFLKTQTTSALLDFGTSAPEAGLNVEDLSDPQGYIPAVNLDSDAAQKPQGTGDDQADLEFAIKPGSHRGEPAKGEFSGLRKRDVAPDDEVRLVPVPDEDTYPKVEATNETTSRITKEKQQAAQAIKKEAEEDYSRQHMPPSEPGFSRYPSDVTKKDADGNIVLGPNGLPVDWDCTPQNLTTGGWGYDSYSMGGSQDSTYEYFPKQYILLGGLEPKYRGMHEKTVAAVKKHLLFRPLTVDDRDILFSAKIQTSLNPNATPMVDYEMTHLTCFLGGMFALGGKIFDQPQDVEIGARLADGCAWAYEIMPSGIMPEYAFLAPCEQIDDCPWNETAWFERLDPNPGWRNGQADRYYVQLKEYSDTIQEILLQRELRLDAERRGAQVEAASKQAYKVAADDDGEAQKPKAPKAGYDGQLQGAEATSSTPPVMGYAGTHTPQSAQATDLPAAQRKSSRIEKRSEFGTGKSTGAEEDDDDDEDDVPYVPTKTDPVSDAIDRKVQKLEHELNLNSAHGRANSYSEWANQRPLTEPPLPNPPIKPLTHEEFVKDRIKNEHLQPGFVSMMDRRYILRPEAIESVWYLYRITGDPSWQEKGWRMFEAVIKATQTNVGHSAIDDVAFPSGPRHMDNMESFWLAETLKYFYLLFTTPDVISLDDWVFNTEAHPFRRPDASVSARSSSSSSSSSAARRPASEDLGGL